MARVSRRGQSCPIHRTDVETVSRCDEPSESANRFRTCSFLACFRVLSDLYGFTSINTSPRGEYILSIRGSAYGAVESLGESQLLLGRYLQEHQSPSWRESNVRAQDPAR